ncbi:MAG TPA: HDOD domain-containing protein [Planctomycetota bacterium]|nr:HDOD domain-containing protein [Planctomycetota bacterium]
MGAHIQDILAAIKSLEPLPQVAMRVVQIASHEDVVPRDLVGVIETDAAVTAKVLKLCNSAYYGFKREIGSLPEAANLLGVSTLVNLVLTSCSGRYFRDYGQVDSQTANRLWEESVVDAIASSMIARLEGHVDKNRAYTAGLLQNVGHLVIARHARATALRVQSEVARGASLLEAEATVLGLHHAEIGARLAEKWNFPENLVDTIRHHHTPEAARLDPRLASITHLGEVVTRSFLSGNPLERDPYGLCERAYLLAGIERDAFEMMGDVLSAELDKAREFLQAA